MDQGALNVRRLQEERGQDPPGDTAVTFDGTWMRRGHTSLHGAVTAIAWPIGQVLDFEVYSTFCHTCSQQRVALGAGKLTQAEFDEQQAAHNCSVTSTGSSGAMEVQRAVDLWTRSEEKYNLRYVTFIGDGDCKGYQAVANSSPYGTECEVEKEECVGHVQKRVGTRLRDLKKRLGIKKLTDGKDWRTGPVA